MSRRSSKNTERSTADSRSVILDSDHTAHQHTRVRTENRAACPRASPESRDHVHERRVPPPLHRPARLVRGVRGLHIPAPMLLLNSQLHAPFSTRPMSLAYFGTSPSRRASGPLTHTHEHAATAHHNLVTISMVQDQGTRKGTHPSQRSPVTALARHRARPSPRSPVTALDRPRLRIQAPVSYVTLGSH